LFAATNSIEWADATKRIPFRDGSVDVLYASHMLEHLDRVEVALFLKEANRVLRSGGTIRIAVPDLALYARRYFETGDADVFVQTTNLTQPKPRTTFQKLRMLVTGGRHHHWMYDGPSLCRLLERAGFENATVLKPGHTRIPDPGQLDLYERADESVYVEALRR
jgi:predicted SAM-dependent methyltransferase